MNLLKTFQDEQDEEFEALYPLTLIHKGNEVQYGVKSYIHSREVALLKRIEKEVGKILTDEIATAHTSESGKTSRLTSAYMRIKSILQ